MQRFAISLALTTLIVLLALPAFAADNGFYLGASVGQSGLKIGDIDEDSPDSDFSGDATAFKAFAGFRFITFLAVEASYVDFGAANDTPEGFDGTIETDLTGFDVFAVGLLPLGIADIFVKAGMINWDASITAQSGDQMQTLSDDGTDPVYGIGVQFRIKSFAIRGEVEYFDVDGAEYVYMYSVGGSYTF